jgi:hypothetical protein
MGDLGDWGFETYSSYHDVDSHKEKEEKVMNDENNNIRQIVAGIVLLISIEMLTTKEPDRVINDCTILLEDFIHDNYVKK